MTSDYVRCSFIKARWVIFLSYSSSFSAAAPPSPPVLLLFFSISRLSILAQIKPNWLLLLRLLDVRSIDANLAPKLPRPECIICSVSCNFLANLVMKWYMSYFIYHFTSIPHGLIRTHKWPAPNVSGFIALLVRASHQYREVTRSNPVEVLTFSG